MGKKENLEKIKIEDGLERLEEIIDNLENGEISLEDSIQNFREGARIYKHLEQKLEKARGEVKILLDDFKKTENLDVT
ncbi:MAG: exodeoxyribonuclease VII small subunit [Vulcanimicrobiota bacterium]